MMIMMSHSMCKGFESPQKAVAGASLGPWAKNKSQKAHRRVCRGDTQQVEVRVDIAGDAFVGLDYLLDLMVDEVVERVDVLLYKATNLVAGGG
jgi:hypothetical protein